MPHSVPARTSLTSSLKRRRDSSAPSKITTLSRSTRIGLLRLTEPSVTRQPATTPNLLERNTSRTVAVPTIDSLISVACGRVGAHVEADDARLRSRCELHVGDGDAADTAGDDLHRHFFGGQLVQR